MKVKTILADIVNDFDYKEGLPPEWSSFDLVSFSKTKKLWDFQVKAVENIIKALFLYYDWYEGKKNEFLDRYKEHGLNDTILKKLRIKPSSLSPDIQTILKDHFTVKDDYVEFEQFINRIACWMATGSGKTLVIVKLIEILKKLMDSELINKKKNKNILVLSYRDDLLEQLIELVNEFNEIYYIRGFKIRLLELKQFEQVKHQSLQTFIDEINVFYYRSDLLDTVSKKKIIDFKDYDNFGNWYIILDEAHKGHTEESKRQNIYRAMSRNGFLFNFSATFTDIRDNITTAFNFNLERFIKKDFGKHLYLSRQEVKAFKDKEDYDDYEKQRVVLKAIIILTYIKKIQEKVRNKNPLKSIVYHSPLMLTLVNTVNISTKVTPDLKLFFNEIEKLARDGCKKELLDELIAELRSEFFDKTTEPILVFERDTIKIQRDILLSIKEDDILKKIFNSDGKGKIEVKLIPGNPKEAVLKLDSSPTPFALIKIGNAVKWIKENLPEYTIKGTFDDASIFKKLDKREEFSILMGSRAFYEGWDSNRPNLILYINIGVGKSRSKFLIQSMGRGVRIEPLKDQRRRLRSLKDLSDQALELYKKVASDVFSLETLFIMGTSRKIIHDILEEIKIQSEFAETISLTLNESRNENFKLFIPKYVETETVLIDDENPVKFHINNPQLKLLKQYITDIPEKIVLLANNLIPMDLLNLKKCVANDKDYFEISKKGDTNAPNYPLHILINRLVEHLKTNKNSVNIEELKEEINHFEKVMVEFDSDSELTDFKKLIEKFKESPKDTEEKKSKEQQKKITQFTRKNGYFKDLRINYIRNHHFNPVIISKKEYVDYIKHIIKVPSEVRFLKKLEIFLKEEGKNLDYDWWFSKIDEYYDDIFIPYFEPKNNNFQNFRPDFLFWLRKDDKYYIVFLDPKGDKYITGYSSKIEGFKKIFEEQYPKFTVDGTEVYVRLFLFTKKKKPSQLYPEHWIDDIKDLFEVK